MSTKTQAAAIAVLVVFGALVYWYEQPFRTTTSPDPVVVEEMLGRDPGLPAHEYRGPAQILWARTKLFFRDYGTPLPRGMHFMPRGDVWTYRFPADSAYVPPTGPLDCTIDSSIRDAVLFCRYKTQHDSRSWTYTLSQKADEDSALFVVRASD